jgi:hypothetical protein
MHLGENVSHLKRVGEIGLSGEADLALVDFGRVHVSLFHETHIRLGMVIQKLRRDVI